VGSDPVNFSYLSEMHALRVVSWNVLAPMWVHGDTFPGVNASVVAPENRLPKRLEILDAMSPDIILLQEVQESEFRGISNHYERDYELLGLARNSSDLWRDWRRGNEYEDNGPMVLLRGGIISKVRWESIPLTSAGDTLTFVTEFFGNRNFFVVNTHLETISQETRNEQFSFVLDFLNKKLCGGSEQIFQPIVIWGGDFNERRDGTQENIIRLRNFGFRDCFEELKDKPTCGYKGLDYVWVIGAEDVTGSSIPDIESVDGDMHIGWASALMKVGSDHVPLSTCITFKYLN